MRVKPFLAAVACLVVLALIVRQVSQAVKRTFTPPANLAQVARASPRTQKGLTLLEIDNVSPDRTYNYTDKGPQDIGGSPTYSETDTGLWIKMPENFAISPNCWDSRYNNCGTPFSVIGRASTGETFPLSWRVSNPNSGPSETKDYLLASIPAGYPNSIRWMDVTVDDKRGDTATWRILHLPPMQHVLGPATKAQTAFHQGTIQAIAAASSARTQKTRR